MTQQRMTASEYRAAVVYDRGRRKKNKFNASRAYRCAACGLAVLAPNSACLICRGVNILNFDSRREAAHWDMLRAQEKLGLITELERQVPYEITVEGNKIATYLLDFRWRDDNGARHHQDVKGGPTHTPLSKLKIALVEAQHGIRVEIVR